MTVALVILLAAALPVAVIGAATVAGLVRLGRTLDTAGLR